MAGGEFSGARAVKFLYDSDSRSFLLGFCCRGLLLAYRNCFCSCGSDRKDVWLIARGKLCVFCIGLAHPVLGVRLSVFSFGFQRVVFCSDGLDRHNVLFSSRGLIFMWFCLATAIICFDFAAFCFSGGREFFCWACVNFLFGLSRFINVFVSVSRWACAVFCSSWDFGVSWRSLAVFCCAVMAG